MGAYLGAQTQTKAPARIALQIPRNLRHGEWRTRESDRDVRADLKLCGRRGRVRQR